MLIKA